MWNLRIFVTILCLTLSISALAEVEVSGDVAGDWTVEDSPYIVVGNLRIRSGRILTIEPGVEVLFNEGFKLVINGQIAANGTSEERILFDTNEDGAEWRGIRILDSEDEQQFQYCRFSNSEQTAAYPAVDSRGGAIYTENSHVTIVNCEFFNNSASGEGGAVCFYASEGNFLNNHVHDCYGYTEIVWLQDSHIACRGNLIEDNVGDYGAGLILDGSSSPVEDNIIWRNNSRVMQWGGGFYLVHDSRSIVRNNLIANNRHGGVFIGYGANPIVFERNTIVNNPDGPGIFMVNGGVLNAKDCIVWGHGGDVTLSDGSATISYCDAHQLGGAERGDGIIDEDPMFIDPGAGDYRLQINSPCIDSGDPNSPRDPDGTRADIGCLFSGPAFLIDFSIEEIVFDPLRPGETAFIDFTMTYVEGPMAQILLTFFPSDTVDWFDFQPSEAVLEVGDRVNARALAGIPRNARPGILRNGVEIHAEDAPHPFKVLPVSVEVLPPPDTTLQVIPLEPGWNMISACAIPPSRRMDAIWTDVVERDHLFVVKNQAGRFYRPEAGFDNTGGWDIFQGYTARITEADTLVIFGQTIPQDTTIRIRAGWNLIAYYPSIDMSARTAFAEIDQLIVLVKDDRGHFFSPAINFNNMQPLTRGKGYQISVREAIDFVYPVDRQHQEASVNFTEPTHFTTPVPTNANMSVVLKVDKLGSVANHGEIGAFTSSGLLVGSATFDERTSSMTGLAIWGDDPTTDIIDGAIAGDPIEYRLWNGESELRLNSDWVEGDAAYHTDGFAILSLTATESALPTTIRLHSATPNPFNNSTIIAYDLPAAGIVSLVITDLSGRTIATLASGYEEAGQHRVLWSPNNAAAGIYLAKLSSGNYIATERLVLLK